MTSSAGEVGFNQVRTATAGDGTGALVCSAYSRVVLRLVLSPRWIMWHLLTLGAMVACGFLSAWQWHRAGSAMGSALNVGYGLQWPVFALFFAWIWWRMLRIEIAKLPAPAAPDPRSTPTAAAGPSPFVYRPGGVRPASDADDPELAEYNRMLAALSDRDRTEQD
jgi:DNA-binding transcriptional regulator of glucitol operon